MHELVKMTRDAPTFPGGPVSADVCPDDVAQWEDSGWVVRAEEEPPASPSDGEKTLEQMTLAELRDHAKAHGIAIPATITAKADVLAHVLAASGARASSDVPGQPQA